MPKLEVQNLSKSFGANKVLDNISFTVNNGEFLSFLGPSGCGKTTILKIITGLEEPDSGQVQVGGNSILKLPTEKRNIGIVFQNYALFPHMNVFGNVSYGLKIRKKTKKEIAEKVEWALNLVQMPGIQKRRVNELSGGQQQRVALARALVIEPDILLLDEPLSALDHKIRLEMQQEIRSIQKKLGITTIFVTHDQEEAMSMSDEIILMNNGVIEQKAEPQVLYNKPISVFASDFLGRTSTLKGILKKQDADFFVEGDEFRFKVRNPNGIKVGNDVKAIIRGENFSISREAEPEFCKAVITEKIFSGILCKLLVRLGESRAEAVLMSRDADSFKEGDIIYLGVKPDYISIFESKEE